MPMTFPNAGESAALGTILGKTAYSALTLRLYTAISPAISKDTVLAHVTEATGGGYNPQAITASSWTLTPGSPTKADYPKVTFAFTGPLTANAIVQGYYITRADSVLLAIEAQSPFTPQSAGDSLDITISGITLASLTND